MQPRIKKFLPFAILILSLSYVIACKSTPRTANAPATSPSPGSSLLSTAPAAGPTAIPATGTAGAPGAPGAPGAVNCGNCWAHIFDDKNYKATDDNLMLCGPGKWPNLRNLPNSLKPEWGEEIESIRVGPAATVTVWTGENYTGTSQSYGPGKELPNFLAAPAMKNTISSIEIKCQ